MFLNSFNYFRGIAILFIMAGHTYWVARWEVNLVWERWIANLFSGGTVLFVFISGFLFHHIFYQRYQYRQFLQKKAQNVLVPYLILSVIPIMYWVLVKQAGPFAYFMYGETSSTWDQVVRPILLYLWTGGAVAPWWYIVFIMLTFALSPIYIRFIQCSIKQQQFILLILLLISLQTHRAVNNLYPLQAVVYFASAYAFGIYCSLYKDKIYTTFKGKEYYLLALVFVLAGVQAWLHPYYSLYAKPMFQWGEIDLMHLQKLLLSLFFMVYLHRFEAVKLPILEKLAQASFALYFLHSFVIEGTGIGLRQLGVEFSGNILTWIVMTLFVTWITLRIALMIKRWFGRNSRFVMGW